MKKESEIRNTMIGKIEYLKDIFEDDDLEYLGITKIRLCQEDSMWGIYNQKVIELMATIRLIVNILEIEDDDFEKIFDSIERRDNVLSEDSEVKE